MLNNRFYILSTIGFLYSLILLTSQGVIGFIYFTPIILFLIALLLSLKYLIRAEYSSAIIAFLIGLLMVMIPIMLKFTYYNTLVALIAVTLSLWVYKIKSSVPKLSTITKVLLAATIVNIGFLLVPHETFMRSEASYDDVYVAWKPNLTFDDFSILEFSELEEVEHLDTSKYDAFIANSFYAKVNSAYNYPPALVIACMDKSRSFRKASIGIGDEHLLLHEQIHFNINKHYADKANDSLSKLWGSKKDKLNAVISYFHNKVSTEGDLYDSLTNHGLDTVQQKVWTQRFRME